MLTTDSYYSTPNLDALMAEFGLTPDARALWWRGTAATP